jgi:hypothetical protein
MKRLHNAATRGKGSGTWIRTDWLSCLRPGRTGGAWLIMTKRRPLGPAGAAHHAFVGVKARKTGCTPCSCNPHEFSLGRGRWDKNRTCNLRLWRPHPACRVVSGSVATCHSAPRSLSPCVAGHWRRYWGTTKQSVILISPGCHFGEQLNRIRTLSMCQDGQKQLS